MVWIFWIAGLAISWRYIDLSSTALVASAVAPFCFVVCLVVLVVKIARSLKSGDTGYGGDSDDGSIWDWFDGWWSDDGSSGNNSSGDSGGDGGGD